MKSLEQQVKDLIKKRKISTMKVESGITIKDMLKEASRTFKKIWTQVINDEIYSKPSYSNEAGLYNRTYALQKSVRIDSNTGNGLTTSIVIDNRFAYHPSLTRFSHEVIPQGNANVYVLWDAGWQWKNDRVQKKNFSYHLPSNMTQKAIDKFNVQNKYGLTVKVEYTGSYRVNNDFYTQFN